MHLPPPDSQPLNRTQDRIIDRRPLFQAVLDWGREPMLVGAIIGLFLCIGFAYSLITPPFETPDEIFHYAFARHVAGGYGLPIQAPESTGPWEQEGSQAPLYYMLVGLLTRGINQDDFDQINQVNPRANLGNPLYPGNKNYMLYSAKSHPLAGANLALHIGRWFSLCLGALTLWLTYKLAGLAFPRNPWAQLLTLATVAAIPQFTFLSASLSNDNMIIVLSTAVLYYLALLLTRSDREAIMWWEWVILGLLLGLAALSKLQGLGLGVLAGIVILFLAWRRQTWRPVLLGMPILAGLALLVAGWWYWRNYALYGEIFGIQHLLTITGLRDAPPTWNGLRGEMRGLRYSFWGIFGWFSILMPTWFYSILDGVTILGLSGAGFVYLGGRWSRQRLRDGVTGIHLLQVIWILMSLMLIAYWISIADGAQGRLIFPAIGAFGLVLVSGLDYWSAQTRFLRRLLWLLPGMLVLGSFYTLLILLPGIYDPPLPISSLPLDAQPIHKVYGDGLELIAVQIPQRRFRPGDEVPITLYMRKTKEQTQDYELFIQLLDNSNIQIGNITTHPGWGIHPLSLWQEGAYYADSYRIRVTDTIDQRSPLLARVYMGFIDPESTAPESENLLPVQGDGPKIDSRTIGYVEIVPDQPPNPRPLDMRPMQANLNDTIQLTGYRFPESISLQRLDALPVTLFWEARGYPIFNYTAFVHLLGPDGALVSSHDQPPAQGRFPTERWQPGDVSLSDFLLPLRRELAPGEYELWVGLYHFEGETLLRAPVLYSDRLMQDDRVYLGTVQLLD